MQIHFLYAVPYNHLLSPSTSTPLVAVDALLGDHPGEQIDLGDNGSSPGLAVDLLSDDGSAVPLEELVQVAELGVACDLDELATAANLSALAVQVQPAEVLDDLVELAEVEHDVLDLRPGCCAAGGDVGEQVAQCDEADEALLAGVGVGGDGKLVEALLAHGLDGLAAGRVGGDGCYGPQAQRGNGGAVEGVVLVCLAERKAACDVGGLGCVGGSLGEEVVGSEPVIINELLNVSISEVRHMKHYTPC